MSRRIKKARITPERLAAMVRLPEVTRRYIRGETQQMIAAHFGVAQPQISRDIRKVKLELLKESKNTMREGQARIESELREIRRNAWEGWERSVKDAERQKISTGSEGEGKNKKAKGARIEKITEGQCGDPRFLAIIALCDRQLADLRAWNEPRRTEITGAGGEPVQIRILEPINPHTRTEPPSGSLIGPPR